jgi:lipopolysaccharide exporter
MQLITSALQSLKAKLPSGLSSDGLKARVFRGGIWLGAGSMTEQVFRFTRNMILARLLAPEAFGIMAIINSTSAIIQCLTEVGVKEGLIQNPNGDKEEYAGAAWWLAFGRSLLIYVVLFAAAPFLARFYHNADLRGLFRVATLGVIFEGSMSTAAYVALKHMKFSRWAIVNHGGAIVGVLTALGLSYFIRDVWALAIGLLVESVGRFIFSYIVCPYLPPISWNGHAMRDLLHFSRGVFGMPLLNLIFMRADVFVLGKLYSSTDLGLYAMAIYLVQTPTVFIINVLAQTLMPTFAHVQQEPERVNRILLQITSVIFIVGMPGLIFLIFSGHSVLTLVYGQRYGAGSMAMVLAAGVALLNIANNQITSVFYASGAPQLHRRCVAVMAVLIVVLIYPFVRIFGMFGGQVAALICIIAGYLFQIERIRHLTGLKLADYRKSVMLGSVISLSGAAVYLAATWIGSSTRPIPNILLGGLGCLLTYLIAYSIVMRGRSRGTSSVFEW